MGGNLLKPVVHTEAATPGGVFYRISQTDGDAPRLLMVMGYAGSLRTWPIIFIEQLAQSFVVLSYDNVGTGLTAALATPNDYSISAMAQSIAEITDHLQWQHFHLLGYSMGGCIAMQYAHDHAAQIQSLVLLSTTAGGKDRTRPAPEVRETLVNPPGATLWEMYLSTFQLMFPEDVMPSVMETIRGIYEQSKNFLIGATTLSGHDVAFRQFDGAPLLSALTMPVTVIAGDEDRLIAFKDMQSLAAKIPHARLLVIPHCGHAPHIQNEAEVLDAITQQLQPA
ncbi:MAG: alpha/beta hydrolase [Candidatus Obscuribacterales bacterium]